MRSWTSATLTGFPEMMDGRLKTLHPRVHGGLLAIRNDPAHLAAMIAHGIAPIDLLVVNLYPFEDALRRGAPFDEMIENIDIGGPAMIRAAAKNHRDVLAIVDVADYDALLAELDAQGGSTRRSFRRAMAQKAFARTAAYDSAISNWLARETHEAAPDWRAFGGKLASALRYGENPHQAAAFYLGPEARPGVATALQAQGKELSYNNIADTDAAYELVAEFDAEASAAVAIIKHANPCGVAIGATLLEAYEKALACDPVSAFGGVVALNRRLDADAAWKIVEIFTEVIIAPDVDDEALAILAAKKNLRLLIAGALPDPRAPTLTVRSVAGGLLVQDRDNGVLDPAALKVVTKRAPTATELADLEFAWRVCKYVKSNAIVYAKDGATVGIGAGQMSRVDSARIARAKGEGRGRRGDARDRRLGRRLRRVFPLRRRARRGDRGRRDRRDPARRLAARRRSDRRRRRGRGRDGLHGHAAFPALRPHRNDPPLNGAPLRQTVKRLQISRATGRPRSHLAHAAPQGV